MTQYLLCQLHKEGWGVMSVGKVDCPTGGKAANEFETLGKQQPGTLEQLQERLPSLSVEQRPGAAMPSDGAKKHKLSGVQSNKQKQRKDNNQQQTNRETNVLSIQEQTNKNQAPILKPLHLQEHMKPKVISPSTDISQKLVPSSTEISPKAPQSITKKTQKSILPPTKAKQCIDPSPKNSLPKPSLSTKNPQNIGIQEKQEVAKLDKPVLSKNSKEQAKGNLKTQMGCSSEGKDLSNPGKQKVVAKKEKGVKLAKEPNVAKPMKGRPKKEKIPSAAAVPLEKTEKLNDNAKRPNDSDAKTGAESATKRRKESTEKNVENKTIVKGEMSLISNPDSKPDLKNGAKKVIEANKNVPVQKAFQGDISQNLAETKMSQKRDAPEHLAAKNISPRVLLPEVGQNNSPKTNQGAVPASVSDAADSGNKPSQAKENCRPPKVQPKVCVQARKPVESKRGEKVFSVPMSFGVASSQVRHLNIFVSVLT